MDVERIREDFPVLSKPISGKLPIYFDNACMTLRPRQVVEAMNEYYENYPACGGRSLHKFGLKVTRLCDEAREKISRIIGAERSDEVIFTKNCTEAINLVANSLALKSGDTVVTTDYEHNSNLVPWLVLSERIGTKHVAVRSNDDTTFNMSEFEKAMNRSVKLVSMVHTSNLCGVTIPAKAIIEESHERGALVMLDGAQSAPHMKIDVRDLDVDFFAFSIHKMCGPSGIGVLYGKRDELEKLRPFITGGDTVSDTHYDSYTLLEPPERFEAGLQNYAGIIGAGAAAEYLAAVGLEEIEQHEVNLNRAMTQQLADVDKLTLIGPHEPSLRRGIFSFNVKGMNPHDVAMILDEVANIMIRSGRHCVHSWFNAHGLEGSARASLYFYNTLKEVKIFTDTVRQVVKDLA
ncbi:MAG: cysteine desulfurase [Promethearchaeati archaeon SRVP18_Atabeyarchaeia-1]